MDINSRQVTHFPEHSRFSVTIDGLESFIHYVETSDALDIVSTQVAPQHRGGGVAAKLTEAALAYAESKNLKVIPSCSYTAAYLTRRKPK